MDKSSFMHITLEVLPKEWLMGLTQQLHIFRGGEEGWIIKVLNKVQYVTMVQNG